MQAALVPTQARPAICARPAARNVSRAARAGKDDSLFNLAKDAIDEVKAASSGQGKTSNDGETRPYEKFSEEPAYDSESRKAQKEAYRAKEEMNDGTATAEEAAKAGNKANKSAGNSG